MLCLLPVGVWAAQVAPATPSDLTGHWVVYAVVGLFAVAYVLAMLEESTSLRKSKPMVFAASLIWILIASVCVEDGNGQRSAQAFRAFLEGYAELFLFILVSMTYLNAMEQRGVFENLRLWLLSKDFGYRKLFWITGAQAFLLSSVCSNLTTALVLGTVILAVAPDNRRFLGITFTNIVVATNAGGSFSPFGDVTTLLVWQQGKVPFADFFSLFLPSLVNFLVPAAFMHFYVPSDHPAAAGQPRPLQHGAKGIIVLFVLTIVTAVGFEDYLHLPPAAGMLAGLTYLSFYFFYLYKVRVEWKRRSQSAAADSPAGSPDGADEQRETKSHFDVFHSVAGLEWDTLLYFYGVMASVAGLSFIGLLTVASHLLYSGLDTTVANVLIGAVSAFIENGTVMYTVLAMAPPLSEGQWLLVTLTVGLGGSLLAIGSAAGIGLMGLSKGAYSFSSHLNWTPLIALGYLASIATHLALNSHLF